ncbi:hypothetical protein [Thiothrix unzii]|uniref:Uncharacterized protein n=1 Tax=Thiothrix unzii TaxID=111769 RepID=A0A975F930_9GAMM|nr:hypothetical protein [Thiothrix unzii]QTR53681.1 hypothetical protein J9260_00905 [Thiothrix unzii]
MANTIRVTGCDNQLILIAYQWGASYEVGTIQSGDKAVDVTINISNNPYQGQIKLNGLWTPLSGSYEVGLPAGQYHLAIIGLDWGGPQHFNVEVNGTRLAYPYRNAGEGTVWTPAPILLTVQ